MSDDVLEGCEVFDRRGAPTQKEPFVTIQMRGLISLNRAAYQALGEPEPIELPYSPSKRIIGIRPGDPKTPHSYPLRKQNRGGTYLIAGKAFTTHYEIDTKVARRYGVEARANILLGPRVELAIPRVLDSDRRGHVPLG